MAGPFFAAYFDGTTTLDAYTPDLGGAITAIEVDLNNGSMSNTGNVPATSVMEVSGGMLRFPDTLVTKTVALKLGTDSPAEDYAVEIKMDVNPNQTTAYFLFALRGATPGAPAWTSAKHFIGGEIDFSSAAYGVPYANWADGDDTYDYASGSNVGPYADASRTFTLRVEVSGGVVSLYVDDVLAKQHTPSSPTPPTAGRETYIVLDFGQSGPETSGGYILTPIRQIVAWDGAVPCTFTGEHGGRYTVSSIGSTYPTVQGFNKTHSGDWTLESRTGMRLDSGTLPVGTLSSTGSITNVATFAGEHGRYILAATGTIAVSTTAALLHRGRYSVSSRTGMQSRANLPRGSVSATATLGSVGRFAATGRRGTISARATLGISARAELIGPAVRALNGGRFAGRAPKGRLSAVASQAVTLAYEGYSITLIPTEVGLEARTTRLTVCPFDHILRLGAKYFGIGPDGVYEITGNTYANAAIVSVIETAPLGDPPNLKRPRALYVGGRLSDDFTAGVKVGEDGAYSFGSAVRAGSRNIRVKFGRGVNSRYLAYTFTNTSGADFQIDDITPENDVLRRTLGGVE